MVEKILSFVFLCLALILFPACGSVQEQAPADMSESVAGTFLHPDEVSAPGQQIPTAETVEDPSDKIYSEEPAIPWYTASRLIYHACGGLDGFMYTNSREAMEHTLSEGNRLIEVDFLFTADGALACVHRWEEFSEDGNPPVLEDFLRQKFEGMYTTMSARDIIDYMERYPALYIVVDTKERDLPVVISELAALCDSDPSILNRFIIQVYGRNMKEKLIDIFPFKDENILFSCYKFGPERYYEILNICRDDNISIVTVPYCSLESDTVQKFLDRGILLFEHTVNLPEEARAALDRGIYGIYTDFLTTGEIDG